MKICVLLLCLLQIFMKQTLRTLGFDIRVFYEILGPEFFQIIMPERIYNPFMAMGFFGNVYLSAGQHQEVIVANTPLP